MLSTITAVISGRTKIYDIDTLLIVGTSSLFNNMMQPMHELTTLLLGKHNYTFGLMVLVLKKGNYSFYADLQGYIYVNIDLLIARVLVSFH